MIGPSRYAIYLAPEPDTPLWRFGSAMLGYDAATGQDVERAHLPGFDDHVVWGMTGDPRRYGFHMTLKAPFRLADDTVLDGLEQTLAEFASTQTHFEVGLLALECRVRADGCGFVCLVPAQRSAALANLEAAAVVAFDRFRAPLTESEYARRRPETLSTVARAHLDRYGYPHVLDLYEPHFSLTGVIENPAPVADAISVALANTSGAVTFSCRSLHIYRQDEPTSRFKVYKRFALTGK